MTWLCHHSQELGSKRCCRCSHPRPTRYVLRRAAGGSLAVNRWLCEACFSIYLGLGLVVGQAYSVPVFNIQSRGTPLRLRDEVRG